MIRLGIDNRTPEEKFLDEMKLEEEKKLNDGMLNLQLCDGQGSMPQVSIIVNTNKNQAPKQNLQKPERSIQLMQERGMAGQRKPVGAIKSGNARPQIQNTGKQIIEGGAIKSGNARPKIQNTNELSTEGQNQF